MLVSMCPMVSGEVFSLYGGWTSIHRVRQPPLLALTLPQAIFSRCGSVGKVHLSSPVARVVSSPTSPERYAYTLLDKTGQPLGGRVYDAVVMTAPLSPTHPIEFLLDDEELDLSPYLADYQVTHATFVKGTLRRDYFLRPEAQRDNGGTLSTILQSVLGKLYEDPALLPSHVFIVDGADKKVTRFPSCHCPPHLSPFSLRRLRSTSPASGSISISRSSLPPAVSHHTPPQDDPHQHSLYKLFSREPLSFSTLSALFSPESSIVLTKKWWAYPLFSPPENTSLPFRMKSRHSVFNSSVLERSVAAMEVSAVSGRNAALLVQKDLMRDAVCPRATTNTQTPS
jgi:hypothetical protein